MDRELAQRISAGLDRFADEMNAFALIIEEIADERERKSYRRSLAKLMTGDYADMCRAIGQQFPDLDPLARRLTSL